MITYFANKRTKNGFFVLQMHGVIGCGHTGRHGDNCRLGGRVVATLEWQLLADGKLDIRGRAIALELPFEDFIVNNIITFSPP